jgi:hypothetical protein
MHGCNVNLHSEASKALVEVRNLPSLSSDFEMRSFDDELLLQKA